MINPQPLTIVVRIPDVSISRSDLHAALGKQVDRYEESGGRAYAQIDIGGGGDQWAATADCVRSIQSAISRLLSDGSIGTPCLDIAMALSNSQLSKSLVVPAALARTAGEAGIDIELSVYRTDDC